jgi:hypothetical protein
MISRGEFGVIGARRMLNLLDEIREHDSIHHLLTGVGKFATDFPQAHTSCYH